MEYRCISADSHIDLCWLPHDLFVSNASRAMKDRMPYVTQIGDMQKWVTKSGRDLGFANGKGATGATSAGRYQYIAGKSGHRIERMAATGLYSDGASDIFRPTTPELRLTDQVRDGVQAEVIYGLLGTGNKMKDPEATVEFYRIYNDWLADFCNYDRRRFVGLASIPNHNVDAAVNEIRRVAKLGLRGLDVSTSHDMVPLWDLHWDPLWKAATEVNLPVHFHTIGSPPVPASSNNLPEEIRLAGEATRTAGGQSVLITILASIIHSGALERYADLRVVLGESGIGWIPYVLDRMDYEYDDRFKGRIPLKMKPSAYWYRQCRATFQNDRIGAKLLDDVGVGNAMWGSDFPHSDGVFPDSQEYIKMQFGHLPSATQRKITCDNAGRFYGLIN